MNARDDTIYSSRLLVIDKGLSDQGHFVQCLTSLIMNAPSMDLMEQSLDCYRKAYDETDPEVSPHAHGALSEMHLLIKTHRRVCQCLNQLFQCTNTTTRHQFIHTFTPLLLAELTNAHEPPSPSTIDILKTFETLLAVVDATLRTSHLDFVDTRVIVACV